MRRPARYWWREGDLTCPGEKLNMSGLQSSALDGAWVNDMATEEVDPRFADLDAWSLTSAMGAMWEGQLAAVAAIGHALPAITAATGAANAALGDHGRIVYIGAGTSGRVAVQDGAELMPTFAWPSERVRFIVAGGESAFVTNIEGAEDDVDDAVTQVNATQHRTTW
jgi:N-acetylmuramic acid 6-phosphate etherase